MTFNFLKTINDRTNVSGVGGRIVAATATARPADVKQTVELEQMWLGILQSLKQKQTKGFQRVAQTHKVLKKKRKQRKKIRKKET